MRGKGSKKEAVCEQAKLNIERSLQLIEQVGPRGNPALVSLVRHKAKELHQALDANDVSIDELRDLIADLELATHSLLSSAGLTRRDHIRSEPKKTADDSRRDAKQRTTSSQSRTQRTDYAKKLDSASRTTSSPWIFWVLAALIVVWIIAGLSPTSPSPQETETVPQPQVSVAPDLDGLGAAVAHIVTDIGFGTGVVVSTDGLVLTCHHVLKGASFLAIRIGDRIYHRDITVVGMDAEKDLAILKVDAYGLTSLSLSTAEPQQGEDLWVIGRPGVSGDLVYEKGEYHGVHYDDEMGIDGLIVKADATQGYSGGPVLNAHGEVVGMTFAIFEDEQSSFTAAIPSSYIRNLKESDKHSVESFPERFSEWLVVTISWFEDLDIDLLVLDEEGKDGLASPADFAVKVKTERLRWFVFRQYDEAPTEHKAQMGSDFRSGRFLVFPWPTEDITLVSPVNVTITIQYPDGDSAKQSGNLECIGVMVDLESESHDFIGMD